MHGNIRIAENGLNALSQHIIFFFFSVTFFLFYLYNIFKMVTDRVSAGTLTLKIFPPFTPYPLNPSLNNGTKSKLRFN